MKEKRLTNLANALNGTTAKAKANPKKIIWLVNFTKAFFFHFIPTSTWFFCRRKNDTKSNIFDT
jgi:hypothetical protein